MIIAARGEGYHVNLILRGFYTGNTMNDTIISFIVILHNITIIERRLLINRAIESHSLTGHRERFWFHTAAFNAIILNRKIKQTLIRTILYRAPVNYFRSNLVCNRGHLTVPYAYLILICVGCSCADIFNIYPCNAIYGISPTSLKEPDIFKFGSFVGSIRPASGRLPVFCRMVCALPINYIICLVVPAFCRTSFILQYTAKLYTVSAVHIGIRCFKRIYTAPVACSIVI